MPGAEIANLQARWSGGALIIEDTSGNAVITINASSGGVAFANAGGITISTGILGGPTISTASLVGGATISTASLVGGVTVGGGGTISGGLTLNSDLTISSGRIAPTGQKTLTVTTSATLTASSAGCAVLVTASDVIITLPGAASTGKQLSYNIISAMATAGQCVVLTCTGETICGGGIAAAAGVNILSNTAATHVKDDYVSLMNTAVSTSWSIMGMAGTWASTT